MRIILTVLAASFQLVHTSSMLIDWSANIVPNSVAYVVNYAPAVGIPPGGTSFSSSALGALVTDTVPACSYTVYISAVMLDGGRKFVTRKTVYSSPNPPELDSIEVGEHEATVSYFSPKEANITYRIEYFPEHHPARVNLVETNATLLLLHSLDSDTVYRITIRSVYSGIQSTEAVESSFRTARTLVSDKDDYLNSAELFDIRTLPPEFNLTTTVVSSMHDYPMGLDKEQASAENVSLMTTERFHVTVSKLETSTDGILPKNDELSYSSNWTSSSAVPLLSLTTSFHSDPKSGTFEETAKPKSVENVTTMEVEIDYRFEMDDPVLPVEQLVSEFGDPSWIHMRAENHVIRVMWSVPNGALCDAFLVNYTVLSITHPKSYSIATLDEFTLIKFFANHTLDLRVFCMLAGSLSKTWWAHRIACLKSPLSVNGLHVISSETDEFYTAQVSIEWNWPTANNFDLFKIVVSYGIGESPLTQLQVREVGPVILDKLKPAQQYRIVVRNESIELGLKSKAAELETITPPFISSTLFPGPISSTAININFDGTDLEQGRFDHYELVVIANNSGNITKRIEKQQEKSMTFAKLIPGKTYHFALFTVYKGMRSRAVIKSVTTYPLKVNALYPVVGYEYVVLYWNVENYAHADCRFRLSYNADKVDTVSVNLKGVNRHRFDGLLPNIYYTFTITVIMGVGKATAESEREMITVYVPSGRLTPTLKRQGSRELLLKFENDQQVFSPLNGALDNIAIIVSDDISLNDDDYELRSWFEVKDDETWGSYRASPSVWQPFTGSSNSASFTIGTDDCRRQSFDEPYCNGILRANVAYEVKLRAYMNTNVAIESDWIQIDGTEVEKSDFGKRSERRFPCHMYLNGCPRKSAAITYQFPTVLCATLVLTLVN